MKFEIKEVQNQVEEMARIASNAGVGVADLAATLWEAARNLRKAQRLASAIDDAASAIRITGKSFWSDEDGVMKIKYRQGEQ